MPGDLPQWKNHLLVLVPRREGEKREGREKGKERRQEERGGEGRGEEGKGEEGRCKKNRGQEDRSNWIGKPDIIVHTWNFSNQEAETERVSLVDNQPGLLE